MNSFADDLGELFFHLAVRDAVIVGHSSGGGEIVSYLSKYGSGRFKKAVLVGAVTPLMIKTASNPEGVDRVVFDFFWQEMDNGRSQLFLDVPNGPFYGFNRLGAKKNEGLVRSWWQQGMNLSLKTLYDCICDFSRRTFPRISGRLAFLFW